MDRHIELDGNLHGPISQKMVENLCADSKNKWNDALLVAKNCLEHRINLWDVIVEKIKSKNIKTD